MFVLRHNMKRFICPLHKLISYGNHYFYYDFQYTNHNKYPGMNLKPYHLKPHNVFLRSISSINLSENELEASDLFKENISKSETELKGKIFDDKESNFHHSVLEMSSEYSDTIFKVDPYFTERYRLCEKEYLELVNLENWDSKSLYAIVNAFISLGVYSNKVNLNLENKEYNKIISALVDKCSLLNDDQLIDCLIVLQHWPPSDSIKAPNFLKVWKFLDNICHKRYVDWTVDKVLFMIDLWFQIKLTKSSFFVFKSLNKISRKTEDLTKAQMVQTLFYMSCTRKLHPGVALREYEYYIQKYVTHMSIEEIGIFAIAFFKTKTAILNIKILMYIMQRVVEEIETLHVMTLTAICKILRFSHKPQIGFTTNDFVNCIVDKRMDSLSLMNSIHVLHISTQMQFYNEKAITKLAEKFYNNPSDARLKDMERVAFVLSLYNFIPASTPDIFEVIIQQLNKPEHISSGKTHPLSLLSLVYFLSLMRYYPEREIQQLVNEEFLRTRYNTKYMYPVQVLHIDFNRVLEGPAGCEHLLSPEIREYMARRHSVQIPDGKNPKPNYFESMMMEIMQLTNEVLGGEEYNLVTYPVPHFPHADILFHLDEKGQPLPIPQSMRERRPFEDVLRPPTSHDWYCVVVGGRNMYMHNVPRLVGEQVTKLRQLQLLGYTPIVIPSHFWKGEKNKAGYLKLKYFNKPD